MVRNLSLNRLFPVVGGGPNFPETTGKPSYDATKKVLTIPIKQNPD